MIGVVNTPLSLRPGHNPQTGEKNYLFDAILRPNASLQPRGFIFLTVAIASVSFAAGIMFMMMGAWPVMGFLILDVALVYVAFRTNYRWARRYETIRLTRRSLVVERVSPSGSLERWRFQPYWLRVNIDEPLQHDSQLVLSSHGKRLRVGSFLSPNERVELAAALTEALAKLR